MPKSRLSASSKVSIVCEASQVPLGFNPLAVWDGLNLTKVLIIRNLPPVFMSTMTEVVFAAVRISHCNTLLLWRMLIISAQWWQFIDLRHGSLYLC